jgi:hypothetical protein
LKIVATRRSRHPNRDAPHAHHPSTRYSTLDQPITLAFVAFVGDERPELRDDTPPSPPQPKVTLERGPGLSNGYIRRVLGKPEPSRADEAQYLAVTRRIERQGF